MSSIKSGSFSPDSTVVSDDCSTDIKRFIGKTNYVEVYLTLFRTVEHFHRKFFYNTNGHMLPSESVTPAKHAILVPCVEMAHVSYTHLITRMLNKFVMTTLKHGTEIHGPK